MKMRTFLLLFYLLNATCLFAQNEAVDSVRSFKIDAELRVRGNILNGYKTLPTKSNSANYLVEQRTRINLNYENKLMVMRVSFQDVRNWGDQSIVTPAGLYGDSASVELYEAWVSLKLGKSLLLKLGRQKLLLDEGRLVANKNWVNQGMAYDAAVFTYSKNDFDISLALSYNNNKFSLFASEYDSLKIKSLNYLYLRKKLGENLIVSLSNIFSGYQPANAPTIIYFKYTVGPYIKFYNEKLLAKSEFYYQTGKTVSGTDVSAYFFNAEVGYHIGNFYLGTGLDYFSGQDPSTELNEKFQAFDILYGSRFKYYGNMNYLVTPGSTKYGGLINPFFKTKVRINNKHQLSAHYHLFRLQKDVVVPTEPENYYDRSLGTELDLIYSFKLHKSIVLKAGYHVAFPSETLEIFKNIEPGTSETPQWLWLMFTFKPTLFSTN